MTFSIACRGPDGNRHYHLGSLRSEQRRDLEMTTKQSGAFFHPEQSHGPGVGDFVAGDASPVVPDLKENLSVGLAERDADEGGSGVADDIGESLLKDSE